MKTPFSELLSSIISQSEVSKNEMIRACDIDRSSFFKFLSGSRVPTAQQLNTICSKLQFSPDEEKALRLEYARVTQGEKAVRSKDRIAALLWKLEETDDLDAFPLSNAREAVISDKIETVTAGEGNVMDLLTGLILREADRSTLQQAGAEASAAKGTSEIDLFLPPQAEELFRWLIGFMRSENGALVKIQHLIELPSRNAEAEQMVMDRLRFALIASTVNSDAYTGYYYYTNTLAGSCVGVFYPYYMITKHYVVLMNGRMNRAVVLTDPGCCADYRNSFLTALNSTLPIVKTVSAKELPAELVSPILYRYGCRRMSDKPFKDDAVVYASPSGIRDYLEGLSDRNAEDAAPGNDRSSTQEKIRILKEAKQKLGTGVFLIDERNIPSARTWYAALSGREKLVLCRKDRASFFIVTESGIVDAFYSFMEELPESGNLLRTEIAARYVDSMMEE